MLPMDLSYQPNLWTVESLSAAAVSELLVAALTHKRAAAPSLALRGRHVALLCSAPDSAPAQLFCDAAAALGAKLSIVRPHAAQLADPQRGDAAARMLGRLYDAIGCDGGDAAMLATLVRESEAPVLTLPSGVQHPTPLLADLMAMQEAAPRPFAQLRMGLVGDEFSPVVAAWRHVARATGLQLCVCASPAVVGEVDFVCEAAGRRCADGRPALLATRRGHWLAEEQVANHRFTMRALLSRALH